MILRELAANAVAVPVVPGKAMLAAAVPVLSLGTRGEFYKPFEAAFLSAIDRLHAPKCAAFYGAGAEAKFIGASYRFMSLGKPRVDVQGHVRVVGANTYHGAPSALVIVNSDGPFVFQHMYVREKGEYHMLDMGTNLRGADFGALLLLHELGHVVGKFGPDVDDDKLNRSYTEAVLQNCFR